ncbi:MAG: translation elongation factor Ts [Candidatus Kerfeldbacteria bacterium RIFOXYA2_FULL_38_24]|uniref:Elongation factor Ts n=1 Tax=Candidatus Kerfeldbacteria bacterium RIFOXYB2_FULL_38_14 TaxID=1798547 RepID=A0A1G2BDE5_9BACT|nr:MAG: translation elongation factor Ts [Candidatus Kerfeldbacteria bacterium RIFOXYA2_FULL_38_24]OGY87152.1 MAG: translation elongation factor Ts [Candidatus Kerfeldbacteria bacterium RIFOXYB2_FULL_38_14]OGY88561.1 MAG: translation elongation factor Ts [Candidatus Kerfeldbacteria bacterium RIFOXYC2_FULL_38_9]
MSTELIQKLRHQTGAGVMDVKKALDESHGDVDQALEILRKRGEAIASKKADRQASEGVIASYVHLNKIGVLVELNCETDFVARTAGFQALAKDLAMQVASMKPLYLSSADVPLEVQAKEKEIYQAQITDNKPQAVKEKIVAGKLKKFFDENCLLNQIFFKNEKQTIQDLLNETIGRLGENIVIRRFIRFSLDDHGTGKNC